MDNALSSIVLYLLAALVGGLIIGWLLRSIAARKQAVALESEWRAKTDTVTRHRDRLTAEVNAMRTTVEAQEAVVHQRDMLVAKTRTELDSALEKEKLLTKNIFTLKAEREEFKNKVVTFQNALHSLKAQSDELQVEFIKSGDFYKSELAKSFEKRKAVEEKYENAKKEYESFRNLLHASRSEHDSVNRMLESAKARLANLDALEQNVIQLEAENAELKHDSALIRQENEALKRDVLELEELKVQNRELAQVLKSMENSRKQYEEDANRYREHADKHEEKSETLRLRLDEVEQNFLEMEKQQRQALKEAREKATSRQLNGSSAIEQEHDNLQEIIGIGKVFEHTLHSLGITSFRQIASFDVSDIARVNAELKEFKGRMEQDDWIGQAKELHFKKYGTATQSQAARVCDQNECNSAQEGQVAGGFAKDGAVQEQIDATIEDAVKHAREQLPKGESLTHCDECGNAIPAARRAAVPGVRFCVNCQAEQDKQNAIAGGINRRGSKDSQLR